MKKGFTLIEMIAVIAIISILMITLIPSILNLVADKQDEVSEVSKQTIYTATENYLSYHTSLYPLIYQKVYCITLEELVKAGEIESPIKDFKTSKEIPLNSVIKVSINVYNDPEFEMVAAGQCQES